MKVDWQYDLVKTIIGWIGGGTFAIILIFVAYKIRKQKPPGMNLCRWLLSQSPELISVEVIWILLLVESGLFFFSWPAFFLSQGPAAGSDYLAYGAPCLAAVIVGVSVIWRESKIEVPIAVSGQAVGVGADREKRSSAKHSWEYIGYLISVLLLLIGYIGYVAAHFSYLTVAWLIIVFCAVSTVCYCIPFTQRRMAEPHGRTEGSALALGVVLVILLATITFFVIDKKEVFSSADAKTVVEQECHCNR